MTRFSINEMTTYRWSFEEDVSHYRTAGIGAIGVWRQKLADYGEERGAELLAGSGLAVSNLLWAGGFTGSDGHTFRESLNDALEAVRLAATLRAGSLVVYTGGRNGHTQNHARRLFTTALAEMLPLARELQVILAVEPMNGFCACDWTFLTSLEQADALVAAFDTPHLKLVLDTYHFGHDPGLLPFIRAAAERIGVVHLGDSTTLPDREHNRQPLGAGAIPLRAIVETLEGAGYRGYYDVELMGEEIEVADYRDLLTSSKRAFEELCRAPTATDR
jgi:sugar phosphate isomerase/epimerase